MGSVKVSVSEVHRFGASMLRWGIQAQEEVPGDGTAHGTRLRTIGVYMAARALVGALEDLLERAEDPATIQAMGRMADEAAETLCLEITGTPREVEPPAGAPAVEVPGTIPPRLNVPENRPTREDRVRAPASRGRWPWQRR